jgi:hypothetical protein
MPVKLAPLGAHLCGTPDPDGGVQHMNVAHSRRELADHGVVLLRCGHIIAVYFV